MSVWDKTLLVNTSSGINQEQIDLADTLSKGLPSITMFKNPAAIIVNHHLLVSKLIAKAFN